jgi:Asp-tRNA(Asn)/Glu-tRNA(Gln) amidotransferase A subunit family amidase
LFAHFPPRAAALQHDFAGGRDFRFATPRGQDMELHGDPQGSPHFARAAEQLRAHGGPSVELDLTPFRDVTTLLYDSSGVAEPCAAIRSFMKAQPAALHPVTRVISDCGAAISAPDTFDAVGRLKSLERKTRPVWESIDVPVTPTTTRRYTIAAVETDLIRLDSNRAHHTNFVNLFDLAAVATPPVCVMPTQCLRPRLGASPGWHTAARMCRCSHSQNGCMHALSRTSARCRVRRAAPAVHGCRHGAAPAETCDARTVEPRLN